MIEQRLELALKNFFERRFLFGADNGDYGN